MSSSEQRKRLRELFSLMNDLGFQVTDCSGKKHRKFNIIAPNGAGFQWVVSSSPSDHRAWLNATQTLKRWLTNSGYADARHHLMIAHGLDQLRSLDLLHANIDDIERAHSRALNTSHQID